MFSEYIIIRYMYFFLNLSFSSVYDEINTQTKTEIATCIREFLNQCGGDKVDELTAKLDDVTDIHARHHATGVVDIARAVFIWSGENAEASLDALCSDGI